MTLSIRELVTPTLPVKTIKSAGNVRVDVGDITELAASIKETGLHQPIEVAVGDDDNAWLIDGHRRLAAVKKLRWKEVPVTVAADLDGMKPDEQRIAVQLVANMQRVDLTPLEEASGYAQLKQFGWKQKQIAARVGRSEAHVSKRLALLDLPDEALDLAEKGRLGPEALYSLTRAASAGGNVSGILSTLTDNHEYDDDPIELEEVEHMADEAIRTAKAGDDLSARKFEYEERGVAVKILDSEGRGLPDLPKDRLGWSFHFDHDEHLNEPCALMCLWIQWGSVTESQHCTDRRRHAPDGASKLKLPEKPRSEEDKRKAEARTRSKALTAAGEAAMAGRPPARDKIIDRLILLYLNDLGSLAHKRAAKLLDMGAEVGGEHKGLSRLYEDADSNRRTKILLAAVLAHGHELSAGTWSTLDKDHIAFLTEIGITYREYT